VAGLITAGRTDRTDPRIAQRLAGLDHSWQNWSRLAGLTGLVTRIARDLTGLVTAGRTGHQDRSRLAGLITAGRTDRTGHQDRSRLAGLVTAGRTDRTGPRIARD
jgi:hypothetical protein